MFLLFHLTFIYSGYEDYNTQISWKAYTLSFMKNLPGHVVVTNILYDMLLTNYIKQMVGLLI